jgi:hypothetical protein
MDMDVPFCGMYSPRATSKIFVTGLGDRRIFRFDTSEDEVGEQEF